MTISLYKSRAPKIYHRFISSEDKIDTIVKLSLESNDSHELDALSHLIETEAPKIAKVLKNKNFILLKPEDKIKQLFESSELTSINKLVQMFSSDTITFDKMTSQLSPEMKLKMERFITSFRSNLSSSRSLDEAQIYTDQLYGEKYTLKKNLGNGTVGETYLASDLITDEIVVVKMLRQNLTPDNLQQEKVLWRNFIQTSFKDLEKEKQLKFMDNFFLEIEKELDFANEIMHAKQMSTTTNVTSVHDIPKIMSADNRLTSMVYKLAQGISLDELISLAKQFKKDPKQYLINNTELIQKHTWLQHPEKWINNLAEDYLVNFMSSKYNVKPRQTNYVHGDPHPGNVFIDYNQSNPIQYIDLGLAFTTKSSNTLHDVNLLIYLINQDSKKLGKHIVEQLKLNPDNNIKNETILIKDIASEIQTKLFDSNINISDPRAVFQLINNICEQRLLSFSMNDLVCQKSYKQAIDVYFELLDLSDNKSSQFLLLSIKSALQGVVYGTLEHPITGLTLIRESMSGIFRSFSTFIDSMEKLFQMPTGQLQKIYNQAILNKLQK